MRSGISLFSVAVLLSGIAVALAADPAANSPSWHHGSVSRLDQARPGPAAAAEAGPQKYLHIELQSNDPTVNQDLDKFRIVDESGKEVGENWGYNDAKKLLIFEGHWGSLQGLYLDGFGHREPLVEQAAAAPATVAPATVAPATVATPQPVATPQQIVIAQPSTVTLPTVAPQQVYVPQTVVQSGVTPTTDIYGANPNVVVHDTVPDTYVVHDGYTDPNTVVVHDGANYVDNTHTVVVHDHPNTDTVVVHEHPHDKTVVVHDGDTHDTVVVHDGHGHGHTNVKHVHKGGGGTTTEETTDDANNAIARTTGINPDKGSGDKGSGDKGSGTDKGNGTDAGNGKDNGNGYDSGGGSAGQNTPDSANANGANANGANANANGQTNPNNGNGNGNGNGQGNGQGNPDNANGQNTPNSGNGNAQTTPDNGNGNGQTNPNNGNGQNTPNNANGQTNPNNANGQNTPNNGNAKTNPDNGNGQTTPDNGNGNGNGQNTPNNANGQGTPDNGNGTGNGTGDGNGPGTGPGTGPGQGPGAGPGGYGPAPGPGAGAGYGPGYGPGPYAPAPYGKGPYGPGPYGHVPPPYGYTPYPARYPQQMPQMAYNNQPAPMTYPGQKTPGNSPPIGKMDKVPELVLYVTAGDLAGSGMVYQVEGKDGRVMGKVPLPTTATGIDIYRDKGVVLASPRDGGKIEEIDDTGKLSTIFQQDPSLPHPVKIGMPGNSDTMVVADDMSNQLVMSTIAGTKTKVYQKLDQSDSSQPMSVAVDNDKGVLFSSNGSPGVHKYMGDQSSEDKPMLPNSGGVAADHSSLRWAAAQAPNVIKIYEGKQFVKDLRLPPKKSFYKGGLMSFGPADSLCVAVQADDNPDGEVWILCYDIGKNYVSNSFKWTHEEMHDFAVGPRMVWNRNSPSEFKNTF